MKHYTLIVEAIAIVASATAIAQFIHVQQLKAEVSHQKFARNEWRKNYKRVVTKLSPEAQMSELEKACIDLKFALIVNNLL